MKHDRAASRTTDSAPDLTRSIMGQLGYMRIDPKVARRRAAQRWLVRCAGLAVVIGAGLAGLQIRQAHDGIPQRAEVTIPDAVQEDLDRRRSVFRRISTLIPARASTDVPIEPVVQDELPPVVNESGIGIVDDPRMVVPVGPASSHDRDDRDAEAASSDDDAPAPIA